MSKLTYVCHTGKIAINKAARFPHFFSKLKNKNEYFFTSIQNKIRKSIDKLSKKISTDKDVYFTIKLIK